MTDSDWINPNTETRQRSLNKKKSVNIDTTTLVLDNSAISKKPNQVTKSPKSVLKKE